MCLEPPSAFDTIYVYYKSVCQCSLYRTVPQITNIWRPISCLCPVVIWDYFRFLSWSHRIDSNDDISVATKYRWWMGRSHSWGVQFNMEIWDDKRINRSVIQILIGIAFKPFVCTPVKMNMDMCEFCEHTDTHIANAVGSGGW